MESFTHPVLLVVQQRAKKALFGFIVICGEVKSAVALMEELMWIAALTSLRNQKSWASVAQCCDCHIQRPRLLLRSHLCCLKQGLLLLL